VVVPDKGNGSNDQIKQYKK